MHLIHFTAKKLASIFTKGKRPSSDDDVKVIEVEVDPEKAKIRREFLMSGVPEALKQQKIISESCVLSDYPPIPTVSHLQQIPVVLTSDGDGQNENTVISADEDQRAKEMNPWCLADVTLPLKQIQIPETQIHVPNFPTGCVTESLLKVTPAKINVVSKALLYNMCKVRLFFKFL